MSDKTYAIRDPVHNYIIVNQQERSLIDTPFVQRLRWISQLSGVRLVFPGAQHTRIAHAMGVMELAGKYAESVFKDSDQKDHLFQLARLGGLLHDIGHGPFSHAYDDTVYRGLYPNKMHGHDIHRNKIIRSELLRPYIEGCGVEPQALSDLWEGKDPVLQAIVQGALGADRMDFLLRDAYFSGTTHFGTIAHRRLIENAFIADHDGSPALHYKLKVLEDVFQSLLGRFFMYRGVYFHKASAAADILIRKLLEASQEPLNLVNRTKNFEEYQWLNEYTLIGEIMASKDPELEKAQYYTKRLLSRDLPKLVWETTMAESNVVAISGDLTKDAHTIANGRYIENIVKVAKKKRKKISELFVTWTYPMSTIDSREFEAGRVYLYDESNHLGLGKTSCTLQEAMDNTSYFSTFLSSANTRRERYVMIRVFADEKDAKWMRVYNKSLDEKKVASDISETSY